MDKDFVILDGVRNKIIRGKLFPDETVIALTDNKNVEKKTKLGDQGVLTNQGKVYFKETGELYDYNPRHFGKVVPEKGRFNLKKAYTTPTNITMYYCEDCRKEGVEHKIVEFTNKLGWIRICDFCKRYDGPWSHYGDD